MSDEPADETVADAAAPEPEGIPPEEILDTLCSVFPRQVFDGYSTPRERWLHLTNLVREQQREIARVENRCANLEKRVEAMKATVAGELTLDVLEANEKLRAEILTLTNRLHAKADTPK